MFKNQFSPNSLYILLCSKSYQAINGLPKIMTTIYKNPYPEKSYIHIEDILMEDNDIGNGTIAMNYLIKTAKRMEIDYISGNLSSVDKDHFDRSEHYYKKFGFDVEFDASRTSGSIKLNL